MSESMFEGMGVFGHVPTPAEAAAKAFACDPLPEGFWPGYVCGLWDATKDNELCVALIPALVHGEFQHFVEFGRDGNE